jgi:hypothetical protein
MTSSLDRFSTIGAELSSDQLEEVDGGLVWFVIAGLVVLDVYIWSHV